jgi:hypothetical protein
MTGMSDITDKIKAAADRVGSGARELAEKAGPSVKEAAGKVSSEARELAEKAGPSVKEAAGKVGCGVKGAVAKLRGEAPAD